MIYKDDSTSCREYMEVEAPMMLSLMRSHVYDGNNSKLDMFYGQSIRIDDLASSLQTAILTNTDPPEDPQCNQRT